MKIIYMYNHDKKAWTRVGQTMDDNLEKAIRKMTSRYIFNHHDFKVQDTVRKDYKYFCNSKYGLPYWA